MKKEEFYFQWHFMNSCNLRCSHCYQEGYHYEDMPWEKLMIIANQIQPHSESGTCWGGYP